MFHNIFPCDFYCNNYITQIRRWVFGFHNSLLKAFFDAGKCEKHDQLKRDFNYFLNTLNTVL